MMNFFKVLRADGTRWFCRLKMWGVLGGIVVVNYLMMGQDARLIPNSSVVETVYLYTQDPFFVLSLLLAVSLMGTSYCDELESGYLFFCMKRCTQYTYVFSKIIHAFLSALFVLTVGTFLWICSMRLFIPWAFPQTGYFYTIAEHAVPILLYYMNVIFLPSYSSQWSICSLSNIFYFINSDMDSTWKLLATASGVCILSLCIFGFIACKIFRRNNYA